MKLLSPLTCAVLVAGLLFAGGASPALADGRMDPAPRSAPAEARAPVAKLAGTPVEAGEYGQREQESSEVQQFAGGEVIIGAGLVVLALIVVLIVLLLRD